MLLPIIWIGVFGGMPWNSPKDPFCPHMYLWNLKKTTYLFSWKNWQHSGWKTGETFLYEFCFFGYLEKLQQHYSISWILGSVHLLTEFLSDTPKQILHVGHSSTLFWGLWMNILLSMYIWTSVCYCFSYYHTIPVSAPLIMAFADRCQVETGRTVLSWQMAVVGVAASVQQKALLPLSHLHFAALESDIVVLTVLICQTSWQSPCKQTKH